MGDYVRVPDPGARCAIHGCPQGRAGRWRRNSLHIGPYPHAGNTLRTGYPQAGINRSVDAGNQPDRAGYRSCLPIRRECAATMLGRMTGVSVETHAASAVRLTKTYGHGQAAVRALDEVSVTFDRGRFTAVMGPSGSGRIGKQGRYPARSG